MLPGVIHLFYKRIVFLPKCHPDCLSPPPLSVSASQALKGYFSEAFYTASLYYVLTYC